MCYGQVDLKVLEQEVADRVRTAAPQPAEATAPEGIPPELMGGLRGVWARIARVLPRRGQVVAAE